MIGAALFSFTPVPVADVIRMAKATGTRVLRVEIFWQNCELVRGQYVLPPATAALLGALKAADIQPLVLLDYGNHLYPGSSAWNLPPRDDEACQAYARWAGWIVSQVPEAWGFEIYNESNNPMFWANAPDPAQFARLLSIALPVMHGANPKARLLPGGVGGCNGPWGNAAAYMAAVLEAMDPAVLKHLFCLAIHPYNSQGGAATLLDFVKTFRAKTRWSGPLAITEWGVEDDWIGADEMRRAIYEAQMPLYAILAGVRLLTSYSLIDSGPDRANPQMTYGLFHHDVTPKPAATARKTIMDALAGCRSYEIKHIDGGIVEIALTKAAGVTHIAWTTSGTETDYRTPSLHKLAGPVTDALGQRQWLALNNGFVVEATLPANGMPIIVAGT